MRRKPTLAALAADYRNGKIEDELRGDWAVVVFFRVWSFPLVWLFARTAVSPSAITAFSGLLVLMLPASAGLLPLSVAGPAVVALSCAVLILDCVDGALARITARASRFGGMLDFLVDMAHWGLLYASIGLLADRVAGTGFFWTALGCAAGWLRLYARVVRDAGPAKAEATADAAAGISSGVLGGISAGEVLVAFVAGLSGAIPLLLLAGWAFGSIGWLVVFLIAYAVTDVVDAGLQSFGRAAS
ncbi:CDP-alcohol phosphatidyltransferase family protein [Stappia taiwanensis]|uniref:CDP-alcohol phosphatidyltransferase family protein n=1 Tax=Stappia taiwanensis TaxID=992267 RepID=A0A838Y0A7_9HYPH|nr:CDP-alcohol phosphatidyltransferase family protein [Stappia taiwanensis]MBA4612493.1 CDP-alcohol phosphatidyltransferase family protein [Stappia taiwanensis]